nr:MAG TPA: hypothetical protein [Caudoviricetes sp.]
MQAFYRANKKSVKSLRSFLVWRGNTRFLH